VLTGVQSSDSVQAAKRHARELLDFARVAVVSK